MIPDVILKFREKIETLEKDVYAVLRLEREEREMQQSEAQVSTRGSAGGWGTQEGGDQFQSPGPTALWSWKGRDLLLAWYVLGSHLVL